MKKVTILFATLLLVSVSFGQTITIDGDMSDWEASMQFDVLPKEVEGIQDSVDTNWDGIKDGVINPALDVKDIYFTHDDDYLYVRLDINEDGAFADLETMIAGDMQAAIELFIDTDVDVSTGLTWGWWATSGDYWVNLSVPYGWPGFELTLEYGINKFTGSSGADSQWEEVAGASCMLATNLDDNKLEVAIPRAALGETNGDFESTAILVLCEDPTMGWVADTAPNSIGSQKYVYRYGRPQIAIDGEMDDWTQDMQVDVLPNEVEGIQDSVDTNWDGVNDGVINPALDVKDVYFTHDDDYLYVRLDINEDGAFADLETMIAGDMQAAIELFIDTDVDVSTGLTWGWWATSGDYWVNLSVPYGWPGFELTHKFGINKFTGSSGTDSQWEEVLGDSCILATNLDDNKVEIAIPRAAIGEINGDFESTAILVLCEDPTMGWVADIAPSSIGSEKYVYRYGRKQVTIDGEMDEWTAAMQFDVDPHQEEGIQDSVDSDWDGVMDNIINPALDIEDVYVSHDDDNIYVRIDINEDGTFTDLESMVSEGATALIQLYFDTDVDSSTGLTWAYWYTGGDYYVNVTNPYGNPGLEVTQEYGILKFTGLNGLDESFEEVMGYNCVVAKNLDDNKMEVAIPREAIGEKAGGENESTAILVFSEDPTMDWVNDEVPNNAGTYRSIYNYGNPLGDIGTSVEDKHNLQQPVSFTMLQNYPNPFNPETTIGYSLQKAQQITISVYNVLGQKVVTLFNGKQIAGTHKIIWNGKNLTGANVGSGIYFYRIKGEKTAVTKKMILVR